MRELFTDTRMEPDSIPPVRDLTQIVGMPINNTSLGQECFNGWIARQDDGKTPMTFGNTDVRIAEVTGPDGVKNAESVSIDFTEKLMAEAKSFKPKLSGVVATTAYAIVKGAELTPDAKAFESPDAIKIYKGREEMGQALLRYDEKNLYVAWNVIDSSPLQNLGKKAETAFKTGDSVNLFIAPDKTYAGNAIDGVRVLLTNLSGKPIAVVYKPTGTGKPYTFESPVRKTPFGYVAEEVAVKFALTSGPGSYVVTATIPWSVLDITPTSGLKLKGDIGILFSDPTSANIGQRVQWVDKETNVVNDEPTESEFFPAKWGIFDLK